MKVKALTEDNKPNNMMFVALHHETDFPISIIYTELSQSGFTNGGFFKTPETNNLNPSIFIQTLSAADDTEKRIEKLPHSLKIFFRKSVLDIQEFFDVKKVEFKLKREFKFLSQPGLRGIHSDTGADWHFRLIFPLYGQGTCFVDENEVNRKGQRFDFPTDDVTLWQLQRGYCGVIPARKVHQRTVLHKVPPTETFVDTNERITAFMDITLNT